MNQLLIWRTLVNLLFLEAIKITYLIDCKACSGHEHLLVLLARIRVIQMRMKPGLEDLGDGFRKVPSAASVPCVGGIP